MSTIHTLPSGGTVELLDTSELKAKHKRAVQRLLSQFDPATRPTSSIEASDQIIKIVVIGFTDEWFDNLSIADLDTVDKLVVPHGTALYPPAPVPDDAEKPDSPSVPGSE